MDTPQSNNMNYGSTIGNRVGVNVSTITEDDDDTLFAGLQDTEEECTIQSTITVPVSLTLSPDTAPLKTQLGENERTALLLPNMSGNGGTSDEFDYYHNTSPSTTDSTIQLLCNKVLCNKTSCVVIFLVIVFGTTLDYSSSVWDSGTSVLQDEDVSTMGEGFLDPSLIKSLPFPPIRREEYGDDLRHIIDLDLLDTALLHHSGSTNTDKSKPKQPRLNSPLPTQAFWINLIMKNSTSKYPAVTYPYAYRWNNATGLEMAYPSNYRKTSPLTITDAFYPDVSFSFLEGVRDRKIMGYTELSVTLRFNALDSASSSGKEEDGFMETYLVQGTPYTTVKYVNVSPVLTALHTFESISCLSVLASKNGLCTIAGDEFSGVQFVVSATSTSTIQNPIYYILFASEPITFQLSLDKRKLVYFPSTSPTTPSLEQTSYTGVIRLALLPPDTPLDGMLVKQLLHYSSTYPTGARLSIGYIRNMASADTATVTFIYNIEEVHSTTSTSTTTGSTTASSPGKVLILALPHHIRAIATDSNSKLLTSDILQSNNYTCIKGNMTLVVTNRCTMYVEPLLSPSTTSEGNMNTFHPYPKITDKAVLKVLRSTIPKDKKTLAPTATDVYGFGKEITRLAQLALLADLVGLDNTDIVDDVYKYLTNWLDYGEGKGKDNLVYDMDIGGIVSSNGVRDINADFGNGRYNDHHFHYGYIIYASSILSKYNSTFLNKYGSKLDYLVSDIANPNPSLHSLFPFARHKSWYDGHSWASGLFALSNGKSQESSSESIHCYHAVYLWSNIRNGSINGKADSSSMLSNFARLLLAMEIRSVKTYWHTGPHSVYSPYPISNNYMMGNVAMLDVTSTTWFGNKMIYVHLINILPITAITEQLFDKQYVKGEYKNVLQPLANETEISWKGYMLCLKAILYPEEAWDDALGLVQRSYQLDPAISISQVLYWIATRPTDTPWNATLPEDLSPGGGACANNPKCDAYGLEGLCCPTGKGMYLGCCENNEGGLQPTDEDDSSNGNDDTSSTHDASCNSHDTCVSLGLKGVCCPTPDGFFLGCCNAATASTATSLNNKSNRTSTTDDATITDNDTNSITDPPIASPHDRMQTKKPSKDTTTIAKSIGITSCDGYSACSGLKGDCCPTIHGDYLNCCN